MDQLLRQANQQMTPLRRYVSAIKSPVLDSVHKFKSINYRDIELSREEEANMEAQRHLFFTKFGDRSIASLDKIIGKGHSRAWWPSFTPQSFVDSFGDMELFRYCHEKMCHATADSHWHCLIVRRGSLIRRVGQEQWVFALGTLGDTCLLTWPAVRARLGRLSEVWGVDDCQSRRDIGKMVILDIQEIECLPLRWHSPLSLFVKGGREALCGRSGILGVASGPHERYLSIAAREAFWDMELHMLQRIAKSLSINIEQFGMFETLKALVMFVLKLSEESPELQMILSKRTFNDAKALSDLVSEDVIASVFDESEDKKAIEKDEACKRPHPERHRIARHRRPL